jgi:hypothetical protein
VTGTSGAPLEGAAVTLAFDWNANQKSPPPGLDVQPWQLQQLIVDPRLTSLATATGAAGTFRLEGVPAGSYRLDASWGLDRGSAGTTVAVRAGGTETVDLRVGDGKTIEGRVVDGDGQPIAGATVNGWDPANRDPSGNRSSSARSDADGLWKLRNVTGDRWQLTVYAAGYASLQLPGVAAGATGVEARLTTLGWIEGQVLADGRPYAGSFSVSAQYTGANESNDRRGSRAMAPSGKGMFVDGTGQREESFSSPDGRFRIRGLSAGPWKLDVSTAEGWIPASPVEVVVSDGRAAGPAEVRLVRGATISGTLTEDGSAEPVAGGNVSLRLKGGAETGGQTWAWTTTDARGRYVSAGLAGGTYAIVAQTPSGLTVEDEVRLSAGQTLQRDLVALRFGSLTVHVVDAHGKAVEGAHVTIHGERGSVIQPNWDLLVRQRLVDTSKPNAWQRVQQTDAEGVNQRWHVPPGRTSVKVQHAGLGLGGIATVDVAPDRNADVTVTLGDGGR